MNTQTIIELVGYLGSALVLVSFLMTSVFKLRVVNSIGSVIFMTYALIIHSYPTAIMNFCLVLINLHFLWKMRRTGKEYDLVRVDRDDRYLNYIMNRQKADIDACFPGIDRALNENNANINRCYIVTCGGAPVGITLGVEKDEVIDLILDYSYPEYRDFSIGEFMMENLKKDGIDRLTYNGPTEHHMAYLNKMGFVNKGDRYEKVL